MRSLFCSLCLLLAGACTTESPEPQAGNDVQMAPASSTASSESRVASADSVAAADPTASAPSVAPASYESPAAADSAYRNGLAALASGEYSQALALFDSTLMHDADNGLAYLQQGLIYSSLHDFEKSTAKYRSAVAVQPDLLDAWYNLGNNALHQHFYRDALAYYDTLLTKGRRPAFWHNRGRAFLALGHDVAAVASFEEALALDSTYAFGHASLGALAEQKGEFATMRERYAAATSHAPSSDEYWYKLGQANVRTERPGEAMAAFETALELNPYHTAAFFNRARLLQQQGAPEAPRLLARADSLRLEAAAYQRLLRGLENNPGIARLHYEKGMFHVGRRQWKEAQDAFQQALFFDDQHLAARTNLASALMMQGRPEHAIEVYREVIRRHPEAADAHANLGVVLAQQGRIEEARTVWERLLRRDPNNETARRGLATLARPSPIR